VRNVIRRAFYRFLPERVAMSCKVAGIDVHKKVLMVVVTDSAAEELAFEARRFGTTWSELKHLTAWLAERGVEEVVMESTAQYWKPVWFELEPHFRLHLAQAHSNRAPKGRKHDFADSKRLTRRLLAGELLLSFVPEPEQRTWRTLTRGKQQLIQDRVRLQNQLECLLEEARIKLSSVITDLLGISGRRILKAMAEGETDPAKLAELGNERLRATKAELIDALTGRVELIHRQMLTLYLERLALLDQQIETLDQMTAQALRAHQQAVIRLAEVPGLGVDSGQQIVAEVGAEAKAFASAAQFASWVGTCPGKKESAGKNQSGRSPKGNRFLRRLFSQAAHAAVKKKNSHFQTVFRRLLPRLGYQSAIWAIAHRLSRLVWKILHHGVHYIEQGAATTAQAQSRRARKMAQTLRKLGYQVEFPAHPVPGLM
jgi:transposase